MKMEYVTSNKDIDAVEFGDNSVEMVLFVKSKDAMTQVGPDKKYDVVKFLLENKQGKIVQGSTWGTDIPVVDPKIQPGSIIHINGAYASKGSTRYNHGNVPYEISLQKTTEIDILATPEYPEQLEVDAKKVELEDISNWVDQLITVEGFLKTTFRLVKLGSFSYGCAAICDCNETKLQMKVTAYDPDQASGDTSFVFGSKLIVTGYPRIEKDKHQNENISLEVKSVHNIKKVPGPYKSFPEMIKCVRNPKRKAKETITSNPQVQAGKKVKNE